MLAMLVTLSSKGELPTTHNGMKAGKRKMSSPCPTKTPSVKLEKPVAMIHATGIHSTKKAQFHIKPQGVDHKLLCNWEGYMFVVYLTRSHHNRVVLQTVPCCSGEAGGCCPIRVIAANGLSIPFQGYFEDDVTMFDNKFRNMDFLVVEDQPTRRWNTENKTFMV